MTSLLGRVSAGLGWTGPLDLVLRTEADIQAACGIMQVHGRRSGAPALLPVDYCATVGRQLLKTGVSAVHFARLRGLQLSTVSTSVAEAAVLTISQYLAAASAGDTPGEPGAGPPFVSAEGTRFELEALDAKVWIRFWAALNVPPAAIRDSWAPFAGRFATATCALPAELPQAAASRSFAALAAIAALTGMSLVTVQAQPLTGIPAYTITPGVGRQRVTAPTAGTAPLAGVRVLESTRRVHGPFAGHLLRLLGAEVVRIESPGGDPARAEPPCGDGISARFHAFDHGKQRAEIDLNTPAGRMEMLDLARTADVFLHDWTPGQAVRRGLDFRDLARAAPGLIYSSASGWGTERGALGAPATDFAVQAHSGFPAPTLLTVVGLFGGLVNAHGIVEALAQRETTGRGQVVESSLLSAAAHLNAVLRPIEGPPEVPVCTDLNDLVHDPRFAPCLIRDRCVTVASPWHFA
ncbi:CoA transferase [Amycolatopsis sulphurea]|nr:CoA transferase [Amycolatopsis sulphurea]